MAKTVIRITTYNPVTETNFSFSLSDTDLTKIARQVTGVNEIKITKIALLVEDGKTKASIKCKEM